jgi:hypothetical protein
MHKQLEAIVLCGALAIFAAPSSAIASGDKDKNGNSQQQQQSNSQRNNQSNNQSNSQNANITTSGNVSTVNNTTNISTGNAAAGYGTGSFSNSNTNNYIGYPDWMNVAPSQSAVSVDSVTCQGPTLTATASTLTTDAFSNQYGIQGAFGFSVPIGGQADCNAVQAAIRKRATVENSVRIALACKQLEASGIQINTEKFPDLAICASK